MPYFVYHRTAVAGNPWTKEGPFDRDRATALRNYVGRNEGRQAIMRNIKEGDSSSPSDLRAHGLLPK